MKGLGAYGPWGYIVAAFLVVAVVQVVRRDRQERARFRREDEAWRRNEAELRERIDACPACEAKRSAPSHSRSFYAVEGMVLGQPGWNDVREAAHEFEDRFYPRETA